MLCTAVLMSYPPQPGNGVEVVGVASMGYRTFRPMAM
jgi:hypothetical protein